jgi:hypothetical protein
LFERGKTKMAKLFYERSIDKKNIMKKMEIRKGLKEKRSHFKNKSQKGYLGGLKIKILFARITSTFVNSK